MAVPPGLGITVTAGVSYYRITSLGFRTAGTRHHAKVVNGDGAASASPFLVGTSRLAVSWLGGEAAR
jgi:hypothetical protein